MMRELRGLPVVNSMAEGFRSRIAVLREKGIVPTLVILRVGHNPDDLSYEKGIFKRFEPQGAAVRVIELPVDTTQEQLEDALQSCNADTAVHGILIFRPLPKHLSEARLKELIDPRKDVDCLGTVNLAGVFAGSPDAYPPCTAQAVMEILQHAQIDLTGKKTVVVGRSLVVGKPLAMLLLAQNATVTICHTRTRDLASECRAADILIACAGKARMITEEFTAPHQIIVDVGINFVDGRLCGDVDAAVAEKVEALTPVPGGVGTVTTSVLLKHTIRSAELFAEKK